MPVSVFAAAKRLAERSRWSLSNLKIQKLLYLAHMYHLGRFGEALVDGHFEAWGYGPVHPALHHRLKIFGSWPVKNIFRSVPDLEEGEVAALLDAAVDQLSNAAIGKLVASTHRDGGAWATYYRPGGRYITIPNEAIRKEALLQMGCVPL